MSATVILDPAKNAGHASWTYQRADDVNHYWKCDACGVEVGFNKPGVGEPSATDTTLPDDAGIYAGGRCG